MARALVLLAEGVEELEAVTVIDVLRRGGVTVVAAGVAGDGPVVASRGVTLVPDAPLAAVVDEAFDVVVLPGGLGGVERLAADVRVRRLVQTRSAEGRFVAAICAAPLALDAAGVLPEGRFTCYPGIEARLRVGGRREEPVVDAGWLLTSQGPGTAMAFALRLIERLVGGDVRDRVARGLIAG